MTRKGMLAVIVVLLLCSIASAQAPIYTKKTCCAGEDYESLQEFKAREQLNDQKGMKLMLLSERILTLERHTQIVRLKSYPLDRGFGVYKIYGVPGLRYIRDLDLVEP